MRTRAHVIAAAALLSSLVLAACTGGDDPAPTTTTTSSTPTPSSPTTTSVTTTTATTTSTAAPTLDPRKVPLAATKHTQAGADAFARFHIDELDRAAVHGDTSLARSMAAATCGGCGAMVKVVEGLEARNERHEAESLTIVAAGSQDGSKLDAPVINLLIDDAGATIVNGAGTASRRTKAQKFTLRYGLAWDDGHWLITSLNLVR